jgi:hypothetical protein
MARIFIVCLMLSGGSSSVSAQLQSPNIKERDYALGVALAKCFPAKCKLVDGTLLTNDPKRTATVEILIQPGPATGGRTETLEILYSSPGLPATIDQSLSAVWKDVSFLRGSVVTAVVAKEQVGDWRPGEAVVVTTNERTARAVHSLFLEEAQLSGVGGVERAVNSLTNEPNPALAGFLFEYLTRREIAKNPDLGIVLLARLVRNNSVPAAAWSRIFLFLALDYHMVSTNQKLGLDRELARFARDPDPNLAACAIQAIAQISSGDEAFGLAFPGARSKVLRFAIDPWSAKAASRVTPDWRVDSEFKFLRKREASPLYFRSSPKKSAFAWSCRASLLRAGTA